MMLNIQEYSSLRICNGNRTIGKYKLNNLNIFKLNIHVMGALEWVHVAIMHVELLMTEYYELSTRTTGLDFIWR